MHATYTADPDLNPGKRTFAACHPPLRLPFPVYQLTKVSMPEKILKEMIKRKLAAEGGSHVNKQQRDSVNMYSVNVI